MATFEEMNPGSKLTDGHAERKHLGLEDTEATPRATAPVADTPAPDFTITEDPTGKFFTLTKNGEFAGNYATREYAEKAAL